MSSSETKFAVDVMLGRTARWLRLFGCDVLYSPQIGDDNLLFRSLIEKRIVLTRDTRLACRAGASAYLIRSNSLWEQLREICNQFSIEPMLVLKRCPLCNGEISEVSKETIRECVPEYTFQTHDEFWRCAICNKVYWRGSHIELAQKDILEKFGAA